MGRPVYPYELVDPDFCWLVSNFQENYPDHRCVECATLPVVFISVETSDDRARAPKQDTETAAVESKK